MPGKIKKSRQAKKPAVFTTAEKNAFFEKTKRLLESAQGITVQKAASQLGISEFLLHNILVEKGFSFAGLKESVFSARPALKAGAVEKNPEIALLQEIQRQNPMNFRVLLVYSEALRDKSIMPNLRRHLQNALRLKAEKAPSEEIEREMNYLRMILGNVAERMKKGRSIAFRK